MGCASLFSSALVNSLRTVKDRAGRNVKRSSIPIPSSRQHMILV